MIQLALSLQLSALMWWAYNHTHAVGYKGNQAWKTMVFFAHVPKWVMLQQFAPIRG